MEKKKTQHPKKGAAKRLAQKFKELREQPLPKEIFEIVEENYRKNNQMPEKRSALPLDDMET